MRSEARGSALKTPASALEFNGDYLDLWVSAKASSDGRSGTGRMCMVSFVSGRYTNTLFIPALLHSHRSQISSRLDRVAYPV